MKDTKTISSEMCRDLVSALKKTEESGYIAAYCNRSPQTLRQYMANPDSTSFRKAPLEVTDRLVNLVMTTEVFSVDAFSLREGLTGATGWAVEGDYSIWCGHTYCVALEIGDRIGVLPKRISDSVTEIVDCTFMSHDDILRHFWRKVFFGGRVPRQELADLSGTDIYNVAWVGREHPTRGIQPTHEAVMYAMATDAAWATQEVAA